MAESCVSLAGIAAAAAAAREYQNSSEPTNIWTFIFYNRMLFDCLWYHFYRATLCVSAVFAVVLSVRPSVCLSVCLSVALVCCIQTAEDIIKLFSLPGSRVTLFLTPSTGTQFQGESLQRGAKSKGLDFFAIAVYLGYGTRHAHSCYGTLIGSHAHYRMVTFSMTLTDLNPVFNVTA